VNLKALAICNVQLLMSVCMLCDQTSAAAARRWREWNTSNILHINNSGCTFVPEMFLLLMALHLVDTAVASRPVVQLSTMLKEGADSWHVCCSYELDDKQHCGQWQVQQHPVTGAGQRPLC
jgi:hypothetical protein